MPAAAPLEPCTYLDYAATAPLCPAAAAALAPYASCPARGQVPDANPNSLYRQGRAAHQALEQARRDLARAIGARRPDEVVFTGSATEADDAAILGLARAARARRQQAGRGAEAPHAIVSAIEHEAVLQPARALEREGFRVTRLQPDARGFVEVRALEAALCEETVLVSVQAANSEVGSIQPIRELAACAHGTGALFHADAVQALGKMPLDVEALGVDAASFSGHKIGAPRGIGALYLRTRTPFEPLLLGGGQESGKRSGTQNVGGAVAFAAAALAVTQDVEEAAASMGALRDGLYRRLGAMERVQATVDVPAKSLDFLPSIVHVLVSGIESETLVLRLDELGYAVSGGSACSSRSLEPSHVLRAMGIPADAARGALRISFGRETTEADLDGLVAAMPRALEWR